ncbi:MAG TPA: DUF1549 and DUF1553 domain-containing protein [Pirellulales bacterium]
MPRPALKSAVGSLSLAAVMLAGGVARAAEPGDKADHWAYRPLAKHAPPKVTGDAQGLNPIDAFVVAGLQARGMAPAPTADRRTLIRRLSFDLLGLPPTPEEVAQFLADESPTAYEALVDRLLASPHYGERWARHWMDVVHFAETHGNDQDRPRPHAWPYRDYLIQAFNGDQPYARFVAEQVAGDVLFADDPWAIVATGCIAAGPWDESSQRDIRDDTVDKKIAQNLDRDDMLTTVLATFASTTIHCARCHNHKFDPITQAEYYGLQAVFAGVDRANRPYDPDPAVHRRRQALLARRRQVAECRLSLGESSDERLKIETIRTETTDARAANENSADFGGAKGNNAAEGKGAIEIAELLDPAVQSKVAAWEKTHAGLASAWTTLEVVTIVSAEGSSPDKLADGSVRFGGKLPETDTYTMVAETSLTGITAVRLEVLTDDTLPHAGPGRQDNGNLHLSEIYLQAAALAAPATAREVRLENASADFDQQGWTAAMAIDGQVKTAWGIYPEVGKPHLAVFECQAPVGFAGGTALTFTLEQQHGGGHLIGRVRLSATTAAKPVRAGPALPDEVAGALALAPANRSDRQKATLALYVLGEEIERELSALPPPALVYAAASDFTPEGSFKPAKTARPVFVLRRGNVNQPGEPSTPGALACLADLPAKFTLDDPNDEGARRAALAHWLTDRRNVLVWRSIVNRVWHFHFGRGIVETPNDLGRMGAAPTHPELLDWLATWFYEQGGSLKQLHKLIVTSATYRQSSRHHEDYAKIDAGNQYLWRMNRTRLDAESLRDAVLAISGKLDRTMHGPSVKQFVEKPGIHVTPIVDYQSFDVDSPASLRRGVYRFLFRTLPDPFMDSMDCADASQLTPTRNSSVTALQALAMLNDHFMVRQSEHFAQRLRTAHEQLPEQIRAMYQLALGRDPTKNESAALAAYAARHGLANACRLILNSNEFVFVN